MKLANEKLALLEKYEREAEKKAEKKGKSTDCICAWPEDVADTPSGHAEHCPDHARYLAEMRDIAAYGLRKKHKWLIDALNEKYGEPNVAIVIDPEGKRMTGVINDRFFYIETDYAIQNGVVEKLDKPFSFPKNEEWLNKLCEHIDENAAA